MVLFFVRFFKSDRCGLLKIDGENDDRSELDGD